LRRPIVLTAAAAVLLVLYMFALAFMVGFLVNRPATPVWWRNAFGTRLGELAWLSSFHAAGVLLVSLPFAFVIARVYRRLGVALACVITLVTWGTTAASFIADALKSDTLRSATFGARGILIANSIEILVSLPVLVWLMQRLPSNNRWKGP
jgi:hypothetical protein